MGSSEWAVWNWEGLSVVHPCLTPIEYTNIKDFELKLA